MEAHYDLPQWRLGIRQDVRQSGDFGNETWGHRKATGFSEQNHSRFGNLPAWFLISTWEETGYMGYST